MLETNTNKKYVKHYSSDFPCMFISRPFDGNNGINKIIFTYLTDEEECRLENDEDIIITRGDLEFTVRRSLVYAYGELDLNPKSELLKMMYDAPWLNRVYVNQFMPSNYDFETHTSVSNTKLGGWYDTSNPATFMPFLWNCIGKPKKVIIFKDYHDKALILKHEEELKRRREKRKESKEKVSDKNYYKKQMEQLKQSKFERAHLKVN